ncbi:MAG: zinc ribbon domain-containing protein [Anaerolineae bacterium]|nr:zinc ribbon domain-containing protein [Anaerolineae bacterium]
MPSEIQIPSFVMTALQVLLAFGGAFFIALWLSLIVWTFRDMRARSRDIFAIILATLMVTIFGPLGLIVYFLLRPPVTLAELYERALEEEALLQDLEERPRCPGCSRQVKDEWIICPDCHTTLKKICPNCNNSLHLNWNICPFCGSHVATLPVDSDRGDHSGQVSVETKPVEIVTQEMTQESKQQTRETFPPPIDLGDQPQIPEAGSA